MGGEKPTKVQIEFSQGLISQVLNCYKFSNISLWAISLIKKSPHYSDNKSERHLECYLFCERFLVRSFAI